MEILDLRHFASSDLQALLEQENEVWGELLDWDYRSSCEMILRYIDAKILPGYAAVERGSIIGYSFFVYEGAKGVIGDLFVSPQRTDSRSVEMQLLDNVIATLQQSPGVHRIEAQLLAHPAGEVSGPFTSNDFQVYRRLFLERGLPSFENVPSTNRPLHPEFQIRRWMDIDYQPSAGVITAAYKGHIDSEINDQYRTTAGSLRFLNNIVRFPGCGLFDGDSSFVAIDKATHALIGLILCSRVKEDVGHVTQVCLLPEYRGLGIGESLITTTCQSLKNRNFSRLTLTVTEMNRQAVALYNKLGFTTRRAFDAFVWGN